MSNYLERACAVLGENPGDVMAHAVYNDHITIVVDHGIAGCPQFTVRLDDLPEEKDIDATAAAVTLAEKHGVDLRNVTGTGQDGRILLNDVRAAIEEGLQ